MIYLWIYSMTSNSELRLWLQVSHGYKTTGMNVLHLHKFLIVSSIQIWQHQPGSKWALHWNGFCDIADILDQLKCLNYMLNNCLGITDDFKSTFDFTWKFSWGFKTSLDNEKEFTENVFFLNKIHSLHIKGDFSLIIPSSQVLYTVNPG